MYNSLPFDKVIKVIKATAFESIKSPNPNDPLFLNFRIKSNQVGIFNKMAEIIKKNISSVKLLGKNYSYENHGKNIWAEPIQNFFGKIIIIADSTNKQIQSSSLFEYINVMGNTPYMNIKQENEVIFSTPTEKDELIIFNKKFVTMVLPNLSIYSINENSMKSMTEFGCQFLAMSFQTMDSRLQIYRNFFSNKGYAFVLKPDNLRYKRQTVDVGPTNSPDLCPDPMDINTRLGVT